MWYVRRGAELVHPVEVAALLGSDEREPLRAAYGRLAATARAASLREVSSVFERMRAEDAPHPGWLAPLLSARRLDEHVLGLFSAPVQDAVRGVRQSLG